MMMPNVLSNLQQLIIDNHAKKLGKDARHLLVPKPTVDVKTLEKWSLSEDDRASWMGKVGMHKGISAPERQLYSDRGKKRWLSLQSRQYFEGGSLDHTRQLQAGSPTASFSRPMLT